MGWGGSILSQDILKPQDVVAIFEDFALPAQEVDKPVNKRVPGNKS